VIILELRSVVHCLVFDFQVERRSDLELLLVVIYFHLLHLDVHYVDEYFSLRITFESACFLESLIGN